MKPLSTAQDALKSVRLIATDMDGTLTIAGKFRPAFLGALERLKAAGFLVVIVTGRSAGWVSGLAHYLPIAGAVSENGGLFYAGAGAAPHLLPPIADLAIHRQQLGELFAQLQRQFPGIRPSVDNPFRLTDWTFDVQGLSVQDLQHMEAECHDRGWSFTYSTVQCHLMAKGQDKATGLLKVLETYFPQVSPQQVLTVGDSPNDESLFNPALFPLSVGVANLSHYVDQMNHTPCWLTTAAEGQGFVELAELLLD